MAIHIKVFPLIIAILIVSGLLWLPYYAYQLNPVAVAVPELGSVGTVQLSIAKGEGVKEISEQLAAKELVKSAQFFRLYSFFTGKAHKLKPGIYDISPASTTPEIAKQLVSGPANEVEVRIAEGANLAEIDTQLAGFGVILEGALVVVPIADLAADYSFLTKAKTLEGFLFPDTYRFYYGSDPKLVARTFLDNFNQKVRQRIEDSKKGFQEILTIASMIEKEVPDKDERRLVSGIMYKRLSIDMPLQIDATITYAEIHGDAYNTYKWYGLPPGPIGNPGLDAIEAALQPKQSNYLYYLSDPATGKTIFAKTFDEHVANKAKYLK